MIDGVHCLSLLWLRRDGRNPQPTQGVLKHAVKLNSRFSGGYFAVDRLSYRDGDVDITRTFTGKKTVS